MYQNQIILILYLISSIFFIIAIKRLGKIQTARQGNLLSAIGMFIAITATLMKLDSFDPKFIIIGLIIGSIIGIIAALKVEMTSMPEMVAIFNGLGGGASALVATSEYLQKSSTIDIFGLSTIMLAIIIGTLTFSGSIIAFGKLKGFVSKYF